MAGVSSSGFSIKTFEEIRESINNRVYTNVSPELDLSDDSLDGVEIAAVSIELADMWESLQALQASFDPSQASDWTLEQRCAITGTYKSTYTYTRVYGTVELAASTSLPAGSIANLTGKPNTRFATETEVPGDASGGFFDVWFVALEAGPTAVDVGELSEINVAEPGWLSVDNSVAHDTLGTVPETDEELRDKRVRELAGAGSSTLAAIKAAVSRVANVIDVVGFENTSLVPQGLLPRNSIQLIVRGGDDDDIAAAIFAKRAGGGAGTVGATAVAVIDSAGIPQTIRFDRANERDFYASITVEVTSAWEGADGITKVKEAVKAYIDSLHTGDEIIYEKVIGSFIFVTGVYDLSSCAIGLSSPPATSTDIAVAFDDAISCDIADISVTTIPV